MISRDKPLIVEQEAYLRRRYQTTKSSKCVVEDLLSDHRVKISNEELCPYFHRFLLVRRSFVDSYGLPIQPDLVHDPRCVFRVFFANELHEAIALVRLGNPVFGKVNVNYSPGLKHKLPYQTVCDTLVKVAYVDCRLLVLLPAKFVSRSSFPSYCSTYQCRAPDIVTRI